MYGNIIKLDRVDTLRTAVRVLPTDEFMKVYRGYVTGDGVIAFATPPCACPAGGEGAACFIASDGSPGSTGAGGKPKSGTCQINTDLYLESNGCRGEQKPAE